MTEDAPIIIKKYANRRLYDTSQSKYIVLDDLCQMVKDGIDFVVKDAKTEDDLTHSTLTQIIFEHENKEGSVLPIGFLRQIIGVYDNSLCGVLPHYLEASMNQFMENQEQMNQLLQQNMEEFSPLRGFEELTKRNLDMMEQAVEIFTQFNQTFKPFTQPTETVETSNGKNSPTKPKKKG